MNSPDFFLSRAGLRLLWAILAFLPTVQGDSPPQDPAALKSLSLEELSQIEVTTPSKEPVKAFQTPAAIYVITGEDIRRSGATSIPEALRLAPGVEVARIDANKWSIGIRGFGSRLTRSVLVLIDGRTVYTPLFAGTYWEVQDTLMEDIDRIEVIRGPGGTIWGPNAVNGVINIITKDTKDTQGMLVSAGGGNEEQGFVNFRYGGGNGKDFSYRVYGKGFTRSPEDHPDGRNFDDWRARPGRLPHGLEHRQSRHLHPAGRSLRRRGRRERAGHQLYAAVLADRRRQRAALRRKHHGPLEEDSARRQRHPGSGVLRSHQSLRAELRRDRAIPSTSIFCSASACRRGSRFPGARRALQPGERHGGGLRPARSFPTSEPTIF